jgi:hypothetical protein
VTEYGLSLYSDSPMAELVLTSDDGYERVSMSDVDKEITAYENMRGELEAHNMGKWVLIYDCKLIGTFGTFDEAATSAVAKFGRGPYLIRQVGAPPIVLPASVAYRVIYGSDKVRV